MIDLNVNPISAVIQICEFLYPELDVELQFVVGLTEETDGEAFAETFWPSDGSTPVISVDVEVPLIGIVELIAHEFAHVVVGPDCDEDHGQEWEEVFERINQTFNEEYANN